MIWSDRLEDFWLMDWKAKWIKKNAKKLSIAIILCLSLIVLDMHKFVWIPHGEMYSPDSKCKYPIATSEPLHSPLLKRAEIVETNECYIKIYDFHCVFPKMYSARGTTVSFIDNGKIHHIDASPQGITWNNYINATFWDVITRQNTSMKLPTLGIKDTHVYKGIAATCMFLS